MTYKITLSLLIIPCLLTSCMNQVVSIKTDEDLPLTEKEGYLLLAVETDRKLNHIQIGGKKTIRLTNEDLRKGSNYILTNIPAGEYRIKKIEFSSYFGYRMGKGYWSFEVKPGVISYVGHLTIDFSNFGRGFFELVNQSSLALEFLEGKFPNILKNRRVEYWGPGEDRFFDEVRRPTTIENAKSEKL